MLPALRICVVCEEQPSYTSPSGHKGRLCSACKAHRDRIPVEQRQALPPKERRQTCSKCGGPRGLQPDRSWCLSCDKRYHGEYRHTNRKFIAENQRRKREIFKWGLPEGTFSAMVQFQGGRCAICERLFSEFDQQPDFDHDHDTKLFRGLACRHCNRTVIGLVENHLVRSLGLLNTYVIHLRNSFTQEFGSPRKRIANEALQPV